MEPAPVGVEDDLTGDVGAGASGRARLPGERRVDLRGVGTDLLGVGHSEGSEGDESRAMHFRCCKKCTVSNVLESLRPIALTRGEDLRAKWQLLLNCAETELNVIAFIPVSRQQETCELNATIAKTVRTSTHRNGTLLSTSTARSNVYPTFVRIRSLLAYKTRWHGLERMTEDIDRGAKA